MTKEIINPASLPTPRGFNHGLLTTGGKLLFLAGQDASDGEGQHRRAGRYRRAVPAGAP